MLRGRAVGQLKLAADPPRLMMPNRRASAVKHLGDHMLAASPPTPQSTGCDDPELLEALTVVVTSDAQGPKSMHRRQLLHRRLQDP